MSNLVSVTDHECVRRWGLEVYDYLFCNFIILDKKAKEISLDEDTALRFDLLYGWRGENC